MELEDCNSLQILDEERKWMRGRLTKTYVDQLRKNKNIGFGCEELMVITRDRKEWK